MKQNLNELDAKVGIRQNTIDQLNNEIVKLKQKVEHSEIRLQQYQVCKTFIFTYAYFILFL